MITIYKADYNWKRLVQELRAAIDGAGFDTTALMANASLRVNIRPETIEIIHPDQIPESLISDVINAHDPTQLTQDQERDAAAVTLRDLKDLAADFQSEIAALNQAIYTADASAQDATTRFDAIKAVLVDGRAAFANAFKAALVGETGIDIDTIGVNNLTPEQRRHTNAFAGRFASRWANLLMWRQ